MKDPNELKEQEEENIIQSDDAESEEEFDMEPEEDDDGFDDNYGSSTEKYGGYNGFSDDVIDDAFDGDPEATWNVD